MFENILTKENVTFKDLEEIAFKNLIAKVNSSFILKLEFSCASKFYLSSI